MGLAPKVQELQMANVRSPVCSPHEQSGKDLSIRDSTPCGIDESRAFLLLTRGVLHCISGCSFSVRGMS